MVLDPSVNDRQKDSFLERPQDGHVARAVDAIITNSAGNPVNVTGTSAGLSIAGKITIVSIDAVSWTALPTTALLNRNAVSIQNQSGIEMKINYDNTVVGYVGIIIPANSERMYDIRDTVIIYGKSASGTPSIAVEEIS